MTDPNTTPVRVKRVEENSVTECDDLLAVEEPLEIRLGIQSGSERLYRSVSVTMRTPGNDGELAAGFLFTEGIIASGAQIQTIESWGPLSSDGFTRNITKVDLAEDVTVDLRRLERHFYTASSCGVCGKASLDAVRATICRARIEGGPSIDANVLSSLPEQLGAEQEAFTRTGGLHAAALFTPEGRMVAIREDVGRHNALDKLIGHHVLRGRTVDGILLLSGRTSFELIQKSLAAGIAIVAAIGAPSSLAVELAEEFGITLAGFLRKGRMNIYTGAERITGLG